MKYGLIGSALAVFAFVLMLDTSVLGGDKDKPKYTIKQVMVDAHKSGLFKKVAAGTAEKEERQKLAELYKAMMQNDPPKGDKEEWRKTTEVLHKIAEAAIASPEAGKKLMVNCGSCHKKFK